MYQLRNHIFFQEIGLGINESPKPCHSCWKFDVCKIKAILDSNVASNWKKDEEKT